MKLQPLGDRKVQRLVAAGIALGHLVTVHALPAALRGFVLLFALFGGAFGQLFQHGVMLTVEMLLPSYWLVQAGKTVVGSGSWPAEGWIVAAVWTLCLIPLAANRLLARHRHRLNPLPVFS